LLLLIDAFLAELLGLLRWKSEPHKVFHCIDNLLKLDGLEIMKVYDFLFRYFSADYLVLL